MSCESSPVEIQDAFGDPRHRRPSIGLILVLSAALSVGAPATGAAATDAPTEFADPEWLGHVREAIRASEYNVILQAADGLPHVAVAWQAPNRAHGFRTYSAEEGVPVWRTSWSGEPPRGRRGPR